MMERLLHSPSSLFKLGVCQGRDCVLRFEQTAALGLKEVKASVSACIF